MPQLAKHDTGLWSDLVASMLSINSYPLERIYPLIDRLNAEMLTNPTELSQRSAPEVYLKLVTAGYDRGEFMTYLFAERLISLGVYISGYGKTEAEAVLLSGDKDSVERLLMPINGVGPAVVKNFLLLRPR